MDDFCFAGLLCAWHGFLTGTWIHSPTGEKEGSGVLSNRTCAALKKKSHLEAGLLFFPGVPYSCPMGRDDVSHFYGWRELGLREVSNLSSSYVPKGGSASAFSSSGLQTPICCNAFLP